jgi:cobalt-zinc-cadmium efflux system protein
MHNHAHCEHHRPTSFGAAFAIGVVLNGSFVIGEAVFGVYAHSLSLLADAGHNFGDVLGLLMAWAAASLSVRPPTANLTYGYRRSSILAALANSCILLVAVGAIAWEGILRLLNPVAVEGSTVMGIAAVGIVVNGVTALLFARGRHGELNVRSAYLHMLGDAAVAAGVVVAGFAIRLTGRGWIDPVVALAISVLIARASWGVLRESAGLAMDAVPRGVDSSGVLHFLRSAPGVSAVSDVHIWAISTSENALTVRLVAPDGLTDDDLRSVEATLHGKFSIAHTTIQVERTLGPGCSLGPE